MLLVGNALSVDEAAALGVGDMLLLSDQVAARIIPAELDTMPLDPALLDGVAMLSTHQFVAGAIPAAPPENVFAITPMLCVTDINFAFGQLTGLQQGQGINLPPLSQRSNVQLMLGENTVASGTIIINANACAFLIDALASAASDADQNSQSGGSDSDDSDFYDSGAQENPIPDGNSDTETSSPIRQAG
jgi:hypothetical protein